MHRRRLRRSCLSVCPCGLSGCELRARCAQLLPQGLRLHGMLVRDRSGFGLQYPSISMGGQNRTGKIHELPSRSNLA